MKRTPSVRHQGPPALETHFTNLEQAPALESQFGEAPVLDRLEAQVFCTTNPQHLELRECSQQRGDVALDDSGDFPFLPDDVAQEQGLETSEPIRSDHG